MSLYSASRFYDCLICNKIGRNFHTVRLSNNNDDDDVGDDDDHGDDYDDDDHDDNHDENDQDDDHDEDDQNDYHDDKDHDDDKFGRIRERRARDIQFHRRKNLCPHL